MQIKNRLRDKIRSSRFFGPLLGACIGVLIGQLLCGLFFDFGNKKKAETKESVLGSATWGGVEENLTATKDGGHTAAKYYGVFFDVDREGWERIKHDYETLNAKERHQVFLKIGDATRELTFEEFEAIVSPPAGPSSYIPILKHRPRRGANAD